MSKIANFTAGSGSQGDYIELTEITKRIDGTGKVVICGYLNSTAFANKYPPLEQAEYDLGDSTQKKPSSDPDLPDVYTKIQASAVNANDLSAALDTIANLGGKIKLGNSILDLSS